MITTSTIYKNSKSIHENGDALDVLLECVDFLEQTGAFVYKNWIDGEVISPPVLEDYYVTFKVMYPKSITPDPDFIPRLIALDCFVEVNKDEYRRIYYERKDNVKFGDIFDKKMSIHEVNVITFKIPQRYLALDGNTLYNIDGEDTYFNDIEAIYNNEAASAAETEDDDFGEDF